MIDENETTPNESQVDAVKEIPVVEEIPIDDSKTPTGSPGGQIESGSDDYRVVDVDYGPATNVEMSMGSPLSPGAEFKGSPEDKLAFAGMNATEYNTATAGIKEEHVSQGNAEQMAWLQTVVAAALPFLAKGAFEDALKDPAAMWRQAMMAGVEEIRGDRPRFAENGTTKLTGEQARMRVRSAISAGGRCRIPLWNAGIWVTIKAPTEQELCDLESAISLEKIELGWVTNGLVFSSTSVYLSAALVNFIIAHVTDTSYQHHTAKDLLEIIPQTDYNQLVWGMLLAIYSDGYNYEQPCMANPSKCMHVEKGRINFGKMSFVDDRHFTDWQREHMRRRNPGSQPKLDVERYQAEHRFMKNATKKLNDALSVEFKVPSLAEYIASGSRWVDGIVESVDKGFGSDLTDKNRNKLINDRANITLLRQYSHWIRMLSLDKEDRYVEEREALEESIGDIASDDEIFKNFFDGIKAFIDGNTINIHGIPKYPCPSCGDEPNPEILKHPLIFPVDMAETFFTLVGQRIRRMLSRLG